MASTKLDPSTTALAAMVAPTIGDLHQHIARLEKAIKVADALDAAGYTLKQVKALEAPDWAVVAALHGVNKLSEPSQSMVIRFLAARYTVRDKYQKATAAKQRRQRKSSKG